MQEVERELDLSKQAVVDAAEAVEKAVRRREDRAARLEERELRERRPQGRSGIRGPQR